MLFRLGDKSPTACLLGSGRQPRLRKKKKVYMNPGGLPWKACSPKPMSQWRAEPGHRFEAIATYHTKIKFYNKYYYHSTLAG